MNANLPLSRIKGTNVSYGSDDEIIFTDGGFKTDLFSLADNVTVGTIAAVVKVFDAEENRDVHKLMSVNSEYILSPLNRINTMNAIRERIRALALDLVEIGYYYKLDGKEFVHKTPVITSIDYETDETLCELPPKGKFKYNQSNGEVSFRKH